MRISLNKAHFPVTSLGPGRRVGLWVQGCSIHCAGCISVDTWAEDDDKLIDVEQLVGYIRSLDRGEVDGITISGGEPFDQPRALAELLASLDEWRGELAHEVDFLCYSGYPLKKLRRDHPELLGQLDAVITEPFIESKPTDLVWRGSSNQVLRPLSPLGESRYAELIDKASDAPDMQIAVDDSIWFIGVPRIGDMDRILNRAALHGVLAEEASWRT